MRDVNDYRIEGENFLDKYEPVDLWKNSFFQEIRGISEDFFDRCVEVQDDILNSRITPSQFQDESEFITRCVNTEILAKIGGYWNFGDFVRNYLFNIRQEWIDSTPKGAALKEIQGRNAELDEMFEIYKSSLSYPSGSGGSGVSEVGVEQLKSYIIKKGNRFSPNIGFYLKGIAEKQDNFFLSHFIIFMKKYRIKAGMDSVKEDFERALAA